MKLSAVNNNKVIDYIIVMQSHNIAHPIEQHKVMFCYINNWRYISFMGASTFLWRHQLVV